MSFGRLYSTTLTLRFCPGKVVVEHRSSDLDAARRDSEQVANSSVVVNMNVGKVGIAFIKHADLCIRLRFLVS